MRRLVAGFASCLVATVVLLAAGQLTVVHKVRLRPTASTSQPPIPILQQPTQPASAGTAVQAKRLALARSETFEDLVLVKGLR